MSDASILPGPDASAGAGSTGVPLPHDFDEGGDDDRRRLFIVGGIAALVLLLVVGFLVLHKGGGNSSGSATGAVPAGTPPPSLTVPSPSPSASAQPGKVGSGTKLPKKTHTVFAKDPFKPLISVPTSAPSNLGSASVPSGSGGFSFPSGGAKGGSAPTSVPASDGPPLWIELIKTTGSNAVFDVGYAGGKKFRFDVAAPDPSAVQGTVFDNEFALLGVQGGAATVQIGDATPFDMHPGVSHPV